MCAVLIWLNPCFVLLVTIIMTTITYLLLHKLAKYNVSWMLLSIIWTLLIIFLIFTNSRILYIVANILMPCDHMH
jgi:hypothetical protein